MYKISIEGFEKKHDFEELIKIFLRPSEYRLVEDSYGDMCFFGKEKNAVKRQIFEELCKLKEERPLWGILTGIRPVKLFGEYQRRLGSGDSAQELFESKYLVSPKKVALVRRIFEYQTRYMGVVPENSIGIYIGIPFCPSRCYYCSFTSNQVHAKEWKRYMEALGSEISFVGKLMQNKGWFAESVYIGGGTPTTLTDDLLEDLLKKVNDSIISSKTEEITLEAGRPDTITAQKLDIARYGRVNRVSVNPQTMQDSTLKRIGRNHSGLDIVKAFELVKKSGIPVVNADLIAGLEKESVEDFKDTLRQLLELDPDNLTIHSLAVKRASRIGETDKDYHYRHGKKVAAMLGVADKVLGDEPYKPYYLYRQKQMSGSLENIGYCKDGTAGIYNARIMDEHQTIIALGAGGISKIYYPKDDRLERVHNVSNYEIYIQRIEEMIKRKEDNI